MGNFYTNVISKDPRFASTTRIGDPSLLEPLTRQLVEGLVASAHQMGIEVMIYETYRSQDRQQALFNNGATKLRTVGVHHYGLACDIVRVVGGEPSWKGDFSFLGQLAHSSGLIWGGDWGDPNLKHSFVEQRACATLHRRQAREPLCRRLVSRGHLQSLRRRATSVCRRAYGRCSQATGAD